MTLRYSRVPLRSTATIPNLRVDRLREARRQLRVGASALLNATELLGPKDYLVATKTIDLCDFLLLRLARAERRAAA